MKRTSSGWDAHTKAAIEAGKAMEPETKEVRIIYSDAPERAGSVSSNPGKVFALIGPFDGHLDKTDLQKALNMVVRGWNYQQRKNIE